MTQKKYIDNKLPLKETNITSALEMSFKFIPSEFKKSFVEVFGVEPKVYRIHKIHNLMYYPARRPCAGARVCSLAGVLGSDVSFEEFKSAVGFDNLVRLAKLAKTGKVKDATILYNVDPDRGLVSKLVEKSLSKRLEDVIVVDPMAGGGSIPLESLRLGFRVIAADYNPVAYIILKATIEYPAKYGEELYRKVVEEAKNMIEYAKKILEKYYPNDAQGIILARGIKHTCGHIHPLIKSPIISREDKIYVNFESINGKIRISLTKSLPKYSPATCIHCKTPLSEKAALARWVREHVQVIDNLLRGDENIVEKVPELYIPIVIETSGGYRPAEEKDVSLLTDAARDLAKIANEDPMISQIIPDTEIPQGNQVFKPLRTNGLLRWSHMYNPRQLLSLYHLTKYVQDRCRELCEKEGELGAAIATYLALALSKLINYNNIATTWDSGEESVRDIVGAQYALSKEVKLGYDFCELVPHVPPYNLPWAFEIDIAECRKFHLTRGGILPVLRFLCERLHGLGDRVSIVLADAAEFSKWLSELGVTSVDLVHVDPPYYDQHRYGDIMEFFWVVLRRALLPAIEMGYLFCEKEQKLSDWSPYLDEVPRKHEFYGEPGQRGSMFERGMNAFFGEVYKVLNDDGRLVLWFTHSSIQAWEDLFTWLYRNEFEIVKTWQVWSESPHRIRALYKSAFFTSMVIVARKIENRGVILDEKSPEFVKAVEEAVRSSIDTSWSIYGGLCREMIVMAIADGQAVATRFRLIRASEHSDERTIFQRLLANATTCAVSIILRTIAEKLGLGDIYSEYVGNVDNESILYLFALISSGPDLKVPYDFFEKLRKELHAYGSLLVRVRNGKEYEIPVGQALLDLVKGRVHMYAASLATELILRAVREVPEVGSNSFIKNIVSSGRFRREHVAYALYLLEISRFNNVLMNRLKLSDANIALISETLRKLLEEL